MNEYKPTKQELADSVNNTIHDVIDYNLKVLFCGINPGLYTAATGFHFARPGNRFWPALYKSGFTKELLKPYDQEKLLEYKYGITNFVSRTTNAAAELNRKEYELGAKILTEKVLKYKPEYLVVLGIGAYKAGFNRKQAKIGLQDHKIGDTKIWILPNPSGLNANFTPTDLARLFGELREAVN